MLGRAISSGQTAVDTARGVVDWLVAATGQDQVVATPIRILDRPWGVLVAGSVGAEIARSGPSLSERALIETIAAQLSVAVFVDGLIHSSSQQLQRAEALRRVAVDISSKLDLDQILAGLIDDAMVLFAADRAGVLLLRPDGQIAVDVTRNLSASYVDSMRELPTPSLPATAALARRPLFAVGYRDDPLGLKVKSAVVQEGFDTICTAPLLVGDTVLGLLDLYHDRPHVWTSEDLTTLAAFAAQASIAIKNAQNYAQMATWAAQLQSIQHLGARLNRLTSVSEIGLAIASELRELIDYHNVRVYRIFGQDDLIPVAMRGQVGEYLDETPEQLHIKVGRGITGWVAARKVAENLADAAKDPRAETIPGTDPDFDESMLLAPMIFEDQCLGVLVLSKVGLNQFTDDDLRLLVIYASFAAQAMANADSTERLRAQSAALERQLRSRQVLLRMTETMLTTLEPRAVLEQITDRLAELVAYDTVSIAIWDALGGILRPLTAKGVHADDYLREWKPGEEGLATWVVGHGIPQLVPDHRGDPRVRPLGSTGPLEGSLIVVPLRGREGVAGVLTVERLGATNRLSEEEFELVQLFAAQVSIALHNAEIYRAIEVRAQTDGLTGLLNQGTFHQWLARTVATRERFSLLMLDLDYFKLVNDRMGHQAGNNLLRQIAAAIVAAGRESDRVFRYGGDEFVMLLPETDTSGAIAVAERVRDALRRIEVSGTPRRARGRAVRVKGSVGIATFPVDGDSADAILLAADRACFFAKRAGRDRIATASDGLSLAAEFTLQEPTPVDPPLAASGPTVINR